MNLCLAEHITRNQSFSGFAVLNNSIVQKFHVYIEHLISVIELRLSADRVCKSKTFRVKQMK